LQKESEVSSYLLTMAEGSMNNQSSTSVDVQCPKPDSTQTQPCASTTKHQPEGNTYQHVATNPWSQLLAFSTQKVRRAAEGIPILGASVLWQSLYTAEKPPQELEKMNMVSEPSLCQSSRSQLLCHVEQQVATFDKLFSSFIPLNRTGAEIPPPVASVNDGSKTESYKDGSTFNEDSSNHKTKESSIKSVDEGVNLSDSHTLQSNYNLKALENKLALYESKTRKLEEQLKMTKACVEEKGELYNKLSMEWKVSVSERSVLEIRIKYLDAELNNKKGQISELEEEIRNQKVMLAQLEMDLTEKSKEVEIMETKCRDADALIDRFEIEVISLKSKVETYDEKIDILESDLKIKCRIIDEKDVQIDEQNLSIKVLEFEIKKLEMPGFKYAMYSQEASVKKENIEANDVEKVSEHVKYVEVENVETDCESKETEMVVLKQRIAGIERNFFLMESILQATKERLEGPGEENVREY